MNLSGVSRPLVGCCQRIRASTPRDLQPVEVDDRLVHETELAPGQRRVEFRPEGEPIACGHVHGLLEDDRLVAARPLGPVEGDVGVTQEVLRTLAIADGDPDARRHGDRQTLEALDVERRAQYLADPLGDRFRPVGQRDAFGQDDELVTPEAADGVARAEQAHQPAGDGLQESVPGLVAERVVRVLEVVQVHEEGGHGLALAPGPHQHAVGPVEDELAVGQSGQRVVQCPVGEEVLELLAFGGVADVGHVATDRPSLQLVRDHCLDVADAAVPAQHPELEDGRVRRGLELGVEASAQQRPVVGVHVVGGPRADQLTGLVAEELGHGRRQIAVEPFFVDDHGDVRGVLDERSEAVLAEPHGGVGLLLLLHGGTGHSDDEEEDEHAHDGQGRRLGEGEPGREPPLPDADFPDPHADETPQGDRSPCPGPFAGDVGEGHEGVGPPQHRTPPGQVDDGGDGGDLDRHPQVERGARRSPVVESVDDQVGDRHGDEDAQPRPGRHVHDEVEVHQDEDGHEGGRADQVAERGGLEPTARRPFPGVGGHRFDILRLVAVCLVGHRPLITFGRGVPAPVSRRDGEST